ncbi:hypothetical protein PIB30_094342 [Stylosanthes scabra]|uniref:Uncharacterized protein n=1 Tax=Stylosanthes scabra TaxID=79078 RepID=A0ABU6QWS8_9FABA|nr:hypothetical protein [Stylosanthes scabra]
MVNSYGIVVNSFYELEPLFVDHLKTINTSHKYWCVGLLCLADEKPPKASFSEVSNEQLAEIAMGLEESMVSFLWVIRKKDWVLPNFEERVEGRGMVVREWVEQWKILNDERVRWWVCEPLRVELGAGERMRRGSDGGVANDGGAARERKDGGGGVKGGD